MTNETHGEPNIEELGAALRIALRAMKEAASMLDHQQLDGPWDVLLEAMSEVERRTGMSAY